MANRFYYKRLLVCSVIDSKKKHHNNSLLPKHTLLTDCVNKTGKHIIPHSSVAIFREAHDLEHHKKVYGLGMGTFAKSDVLP